MWLPLVAIGLALTLGCSSLLELDALQKSDCSAGDCGATGASAGMKTHGGDQAGASQGGSGSVSIAGGGGSAASGGSGNGGGGAGGAPGSTAGTGGTSSSGGSGSGGGSATAGASGSGGALPIAGGPAGGAAGGPGVNGCKPSATNESCDGLDENCQETPDDAACAGDCAGVFVNGTSYMSCFATSDFNQAEVACQENGMHLVKIDSALEDETVWSLAFDDYVWVGGSNLADFDVFSWVDGTPFYSFVEPISGVYEHFSDTEPDQDERWRCVEQDADGTWSTWDCAEGQSFVCERY
jgi:hypothetical protein